MLERARDPLAARPSGRPAQRLPGPEFMDFEISPDDRIGGAAAKKTRGQGESPGQGARAARPRATNASSPVSAVSFPMTMAAKRRRRAAARQRAAGRKRPRKARKPFSPLRLFGKLFYWLATLGIVAAICVAGVVYYYWMQMPAATTWARARPAGQYPRRRRRRPADLQPRQDGRRGGVARRTAALSCRRRSSPSRTGASTSISAST